jgi:DNA helicase II / ATP-dependent DNA helicase PcrA
MDLHGLNDRQKQAVTHLGGPLLVLAGAGSGKTRVITHRIAFLIAHGVPPHKILGVTFTNKAAKEMRDRVQSLVGRHAGRVQLSTFHALGLSILREEYAAVGLRAGFCIYDTGDQLSLVRELMRHIKVADRRLDAERVLDLILKAKRQNKKEIEIDWGDEYEFAAHELYPRYVDQMRAFNAVDFDDLLQKALLALSQPEVGARWKQRFDHILVDEYQDTSPEQLELLQILVGTENSLCAVGDDDQSIYSWRGAKAQSILAFEQHFSGSSEIVLDQNYRSTTAILSCANAVIGNNKQRKAKSLWSALGNGEPVDLVSCLDGEDEASFVVSKIKELIQNGAKPQDVAILYRSNIQSRTFEELLTDERIPFEVIGGQAFFERKEVRDALAFLSAAYNHYDEVSLRRVVNVPPRGLGPASIERLSGYCDEHQCDFFTALSRADSIEGLPRNAVAGAREFIEWVKRFGTTFKQTPSKDLANVARSYFDALKLRDAIFGSDDAESIRERRLDNLEAILQALSRFAQKNEGDSDILGAFLRNAMLVRTPEEEQERTCVTLMTLHGAKGLEFLYVFMVGLEEDLLPHKKSVEMAQDLNEERRLCYVGMTRAQKRLWLTHAKRRQRYGKWAEITPSRFLHEIPEHEMVKRIDRDSKEASSVMGAQFFKMMREQLGIDQ